MFGNEAILATFFCDYLSKLSGDLSDADLKTETNGKTPQWILGHLRVVADIPRPMVGLEPALDGNWIASYGPGTKPGNADAPQFELEAIVSEIVAAYKELSDVAQRADVDAMSQPHGLELLQGSALKTRGHLLSHILSTHLAFHVAQLSACRQSKGLAPLF